MHAGICRRVVSLLRHHALGILLTHLTTFTNNTDWDIHIKHGKFLF